MPLTEHDGLVYKLGKVRETLLLKKQRRQGLHFLGLKIIYQIARDQK